MSTTAKTEAVAQADAYLSNVDLPTYTELLGLLKRSKAHVADTYRDMLCKVGAYSERTLDAVMAGEVWKRNEADYKDVDAALTKAAEVMP